MARILIVEDEVRIASFLDKGLRACGYTTQVVPDGDLALAMARDGDFDLLLLDLGLPGVNGLDVLTELRGRGERLPVLVLTADKELSTTVASFAGGADDYLAKPFRFAELLARIEARLRVAPGAAPSRLEHGRVSLDLHTRRATVDGRVVELSAREFVLMEAFLRHPQQVLSREQLLSEAWGYGFDPGSNVVDVYVSHLRRKLGGGVIVTARGMGFA